MPKFTLHDAPQRSAEWMALRVGRLTGTGAGDMLAKIKTGEAAARRDLRIRLVCERLTGVSQENGYINAEMQRGIDKEDEAIAAYEAVNGVLIQRCGFLSHPEMHAGVSLDGYLGDFVGIVEVKAPKSATHLRYLLNGKVPTEHLPQICHALWISGAQFCDFVSFDDRFPDDLQLFVKRIYRRDLDIDAHEEAVLQFLIEVERDVTAVKALRKQVA